MKDHKIFFKFFIVCVSMLITVSAMAQNKRISGTIVDATGEAVIGANVQVKGTTIGSISDVDGNFSFEAPQTGTLVISYIGYKTQELALGKNIYTITLAEDSEVLDEVIVVGYATQNKGSLTSAITQVKGDDVFKSKGIANPSVALQGEVAGLTVTRSSTRPGSENAAMKIRGDISINGNSSPLVLIDGMTSSLNELNAMDGNDIETITVLKDASAAIYGSRSASGVVLVTTKRGKKGKAQITYNGSFSRTIDGIKPPLANHKQWLDMFYDAQYQDAIANNPQYANNPEEIHSRINWWIFNSFGGQDVETGESYSGESLFNALRSGKILTLRRGQNIDRWQPTSLVDEMYGQGTSHKHTVSISGADDKFAYRASLNYADNNSQFKLMDDGEKKYGARLNMDYQATKLLKVETGMSYERRDITTPYDYAGRAWEDPWFWPIYNENGQVYDTFSGNRNPVGVAGKDGGHKKNNYSTLRANVKATLDLNDYLEGLSLSFQGSYKEARKEYQEYRKKVQYYDWAGTPTGNRNGPGHLKEEIEKWTNYNLGGFINYNRTFVKKHTVKAMLGMTAENEDYKKISASRNNGPMYAGSDLVDLETMLSHTNNGAGGGQSSWALLSYIGRLNYEYDGRYLLEVLGRRDGSSKLSINQRWKNFYSVSGGWIVTNEAFMEGTSDWLSHLKVRYNYGKTGSVEGIGNYERYATLSSGSVLFGESPTNQTLIRLGGMTSDQRTWETINSHDAGIDFGFLNQRLTGSFDYFQKSNNGMFIPVVYPAIMGASAPKTNNGKFRTKGWEIELNWRDKIGNVQYNIGGFLADASSEVVRIENNENVPNAGLNSNRLEGMPRQAIYVYKTDGIFQTQSEADAYYDQYYWNENRTGPKAGNIIPAPRETGTNRLRPGARKVVDANNDGSITTEDLVYAGDAAPRLTFGLKMGLEWKGIDFSAFFQGVGKQNILRTDRLAYPWQANYTGISNVSYGKQWTPENMNTMYTVASRDNSFNNWNYWAKDVMVQKSRYIRLKSLIVGYTIPQNITRKAALDRVRVYFSGDDLWEWTKVKDGFDPEAGTGSNDTFPFSRLISFGIDVTF
ncbi:TonB-linked SusC/RagA family outer membrane protein [Parabacteroides sp. PFB2-12]|nr:TonB-linked SusC/RagA family outer membrane protein [Parabacteroides sp. PM6-13]MDH6391783.1 TonB-linked SusC/RagA family outer membrane protein [Parabacteroides sp. PFB2-12]